MTLLQSPRSASSTPSEADVRNRLATRRPLVPTATLGGAIAAAAPLLVLQAIAVIGWFVTDAGAHGSPGDALRVGAYGWLLAHGSGLSVEGIRITAVPLGLTLLAAWSIHRVGRRVGESISDHGPDAGRIGDGERDWTVPIAAVLFAAGYSVVAVLTAAVAATVEHAPSTPRVVLWSMLLSLIVGLPALASGSGRAAVWLPLLPTQVRMVGLVGRRIALTWLVVATAAWLVALAMDFATAANIVSQLDADAGDAGLITVLTLGVAPNATLWSSAYLLGPGFSVGAGTVVAPADLVLGPLPLFPLLAALPSGSLAAGWAVVVMTTPALVAAVVVARLQRALPDGTWDRAATRGGVGGILAGLVVGCLTVISDGAVGPGRLQQVGPFAWEVFLHAVTAFGVGGLIGGLAMWWWTNRWSAYAHRWVDPVVARIRSLRR